MIFLHDNAAIVFMCGLLFRAIRFVSMRIKKKKQSKAKSTSDKL